MKNFKRTLSMLLAAVLIACMLMAPASAAADDGVLTGRNNLSTYQFTGDNATRSGYAQGTIAFSSAAGTTYDLYWANDAGILADFEPLATLEATSSSTSFTIARQIVIPKGAASVAIFSGDPGAGLSGAYDVIEIPDAKQLNDETVYSFGSVSDIHVNYDNEGQNATGKWVAALNYYADLGVDNIILSGDMTSNGTTDEFTTYTDCVAKSNYDADRIFEALGNHETQNVGNFLRFTSGGVEAGEVRPSPDTPWYYKIFPGKDGAKDNLFIFMAQELSSTGNSPNEENWSSGQLDWVEGLLRKYAGTNTNIFLVQHTVFKHWGTGDTYEGLYVQPTYADSTYPANLRLKNMLQEYKEVIMMSGHTHISFYEDCNFSDENGTAARMIHNSSTSQPRIINGNALDYTNATADYGSEGYVVNVTDNDVIFYARNFSTGKYIPGACFILESYAESRENVAGIEVTALPDKTVYAPGEVFDPTGMKITAHYKDGASTTVKGYYVDTDTPLTASTKEVTVRFGDAATTVPVEMDVAFEDSGTIAAP